MTRRPRLETGLALGLIVLAAALAYLPLAGQLGYYFDDWNVVWAAETQGMQKLVEMSSIDRPFNGIIFSLLYPLLGSSALAWNISAFFIRLVGGLSLYWIVRMLWPKQQAAATATALIFLLYPGYLRQPNAIQYQIPLLHLTLSLLSIALTVWAIQLKNRAAQLLVIAASLLLTLTSLFMVEYMIGLEGVRFFILFLALSPKREAGRLPLRDGKFWKNLMLRWLPYLLVAAGFLYWRLFIFKSVRAATDVGFLAQKYAESPVYRLLRLILEWGKDFFETLFFAWGALPYRLISEARLRDLEAALILGLLGAAAVLVYLWWNRRGQSEEVMVNAAWGRLMIAAGLLSVLVTLFPIVLSDRGVSFNSSFDRYTFPAILGVALVWAGFLFSFIPPRPRAVILALIVGVSMATQYLNGVYFAGFWKTEQQFWWQMSWRAPQLKDGTVLLANIPDYPIEEDYEVWGPANLVYHDESGALKIYSEVLNLDTAQMVIQGSGSSRYLRTIEFKRDFEKSLVVSMPTQLSCLHLVDSNQVELAEGEEPLVYLVAPYSHSSQVILDDSQHTPPAKIFGQEPVHDWCYYYQKASLARQKGDWGEVNRLGTEASSLDLRPRDRSEWLPFLEALMYTGRFDDARDMIAIVKEVPYLRQQTCEYLSKSLASNPADAAIQKGQSYLKQNLCDS
jgi:hypothetical protein